MNLKFNLIFVVASQLIMQFILQILILRNLGFNAASDIYFAMLIIPNFLLGILSSLISSYYYPIFSDREKINYNIFYKYFKIFSVFSFLLFIPLIPFHNTILSLFTKSISLYESDLTLTSIFFLLNGFVYSLVLFYGFVLRSQEKFFITEFINLIFLMAHGLFLLLNKLDLNSLGISFVIRNLFILFFYKYILYLPATNKKVTKVIDFNIVRNILSGAFVSKIVPSLDRIIAATSAPGNLAILSTSQNLISSIATIFERSYSISAIPKLTHFYKSKNLEEFLDYLYYNIRVIIYFTVFSAFCFYFGKSIIINLLIFVFNDSYFISYKIWTISILFFGIVVALPLGSLFSSALYVVGDSKSQIMITLFSAIILLPLKICLFKFFDIQGLAISISIYFIFNCILLIIFLLRKIHKLNEHN